MYEKIWRKMKSEDIHRYTAEKIRNEELRIINKVCIADVPLTRGKGDSQGGYR
jgi:hypothetical protein